MKNLQHLSPSLGSELVAEEDTEAGLAYFRGIPYASLSKRWTQSVVQSTLPPSFDATTFGPKCPQPAHVSMLATGLHAPTVAVDEFACLNLNVTVPAGALPRIGQKDASLLPVMVWIHGGAFQNGSNSDPRFSPNALSSLAKQAGQPFILVQINYRLGVFGFSVSSDLATEYSSDPASTSQSSNYFANFGILDQRNAFQWVQTHIQDFGGDPSNVTAVGVSAGSASIHLHVLSGSPLFDRAILMSGSAPTMGPFPIQFAEAGWMRFCKTSGVIEDSSQVRLLKLRSLSAEDAMKNSPNATFFPFADGKLLPKIWQLGDPHPVSRCKDIVIGTTKVEAIIFDGLSRLLPQKYMHAKIGAAFPPADAEIFCKYFDFTPLEEQTPEAYRDAIRFLLSTIMFHYPSLRIAETFGGNASLYNFEEYSPFEGPTYGMSVHGQCAVFLFGNGRETWPAPSQKVSLEMGKDWVNFVYGKQPWERYPENEKFMRFGPEGESGLMALGDDEARSYEYLPWLREHFDEAMMLVLSLMS